jgi:hypothetical protein
MKCTFIMLLIILFSLVGFESRCGVDFDPPPSGSLIRWGTPTDFGPITAHLGCTHGDGGDNRCRNRHQGIDIGVPDHTPVKAAADGIIVAMDTIGLGSEGIWVRIDHTGGWVSEYWHLESIEDHWARLGFRQINRGELIGFSGHTGRNSITGNPVGPHLHFNIRLNGRYMNPLRLIPPYAQDLAMNACGERFDGSTCTPDCAACPAGAPGFVSPSGGGGLESAPLWLWSSRKSADRKTPQPGELISPPPLWKWVNKTSSEDHWDKTKTSEAVSAFSISLAELMPAALPNTSRNLTQPKDVIGNSNALEVTGADYLGTGTSNNVASIVAFRTQGAVYAHDYAVCNRFNDGYLAFLKPMDVSQYLGTPFPVYFWGAFMRRMVGNQSSEEYATVFAVHVSADEREFEVNSNWISDQYAGAAGGYFLTFQVWSNDPMTSGSLGNNILQALAARGTLRFINTQQPTTPNVFIAGAKYEDGQAVLSIENTTDIGQEVEFTAVTWSASVPESESQVTFKRSIASGLNTIQLPLPDALSGVIYAKDSEGFVDKVYVADGSWSQFSDSLTTVKLTFSNCASAGNLTAVDRRVAGCAEMSGTVGERGWAGISRTLDQPGQPFVNVSRYRALTFFAKGDGKSYRVSIITDSIKRLNSTDFHQFVFTPPPEERQFVIPIASFSQQGWDTSKLVPFTGEDVTGLSWSSVGDPLDSINLSVEKIGFVNSTIISDVTARPNTSDTAGPYPVQAKISDDVAVRTATLLYSVDGGRSFNRVPMAMSGSDLYSASVPGQPLGTEVRYYVEATDSDGNIATNPVDVPYTAYRFQVSDYPYLLADDFGDTNPENARGGSPFLFGAGSGGSLQAFYDRESLKLVYNVTTPNSFAGYSTPLGRANLDPYSFITFLVRGAAGGERMKVGLKDASGNEIKIPLSDYLPGGVTTSWQKVAVPLYAFAGLASRSAIESFVIAFENAIGSERGTVFIDDIKFETITTPLPTSVPLLLAEGSTRRAIALDSVTLLRDPFRLDSVVNFSSDHRTRIMFFATNLFRPPQVTPVIIAQAEDSQHRVFPLSIEYVGGVPGQDWLTQVVVKLPSEITSSGNVWVSITVGGIQSNQVILSVQ